MLDTKNYKMKRPKNGYNSEKEKQYAQMSGVSDWEVFFKNKRIGRIFKSVTYSGDWGWVLDYDELEKGVHDYSVTRKDALDDLIYEHQKIRRYS